MAGHTCDESQGCQPSPSAPCPCTHPGPGSGRLRQSTCSTGIRAARVSPEISCFGAARQISAGAPIPLHACTPAVSSLLAVPLGAQVEDGAAPETVLHTQLHRLRAGGRETRHTSSHSAAAHSHTSHSGARAKALAAHMSQSRLCEAPATQRRLPASPATGPPGTAARPGKSTLRCRGQRRRGASSPQPAWCAGSAAPALGAPLQGRQAGGREGKERGGQGE